MNSSNKGADPKALANVIDSSMKSKTGIVAYFDILGYTKLITNNGIDFISKMIFDRLKKIPKIVGDMAIKGFTVKGSIADDCINNIKPLIFSDTILLNLSLSDTPEVLPLIRWVCFLNYCGSLMNIMFEYGLPVRGAISYGDYFVEDASFAGKPFIDCHNLSKIQNWCGCIFTEKAENQCKIDVSKGLGRKVSEFYDVFSFAVLKYSVPFKDFEKIYLTLNWPSEIGKDKPIKNESEIRSYVISSFLSHKKSYSPEVYSKIINTEMFIHYVVKNYHAEKE